jgi:predicted methyltransferase
MIRSSVVVTAIAAVSLLAACGQGAPAPAEVAAPPPPVQEVMPAAMGVPAYVTAAVNDAGRTAEHHENDAVRSPAEVIAFSGMAPGDIVVDYRPGGGYYTRIFSKVVGENGKVYATESAERMEGRPDRTEAVDAIAADPAYSNVEVAAPPFAAVDEIGEPVDVVWLSNNYHDVVNAATVEGMVSFNEGVFRALNPGGTYIIVDHAAPLGSGYADTDTTHRIDAGVVIEAMTAVGFVLDEESDLLSRPEDDRTTQGTFATAQLILKFRKPE